MQLLEDVRRTGKPFVASEVPIMLPTTAERGPRQAWLAGTYAPMRGRDGSVEGIISFATR